MNKIVWFALATSIFSLASALIAEYGFGLKPCELCIMQRVPYAAVIVLSLLALAKTPYQKNILYVIAVLFFIGGGIATYHAAVEKHMVKGPDTCTSSATANLSVDELLQKIKSAPVVACDQPAWEFHGITMASMNALWSFVLGITTLTLMRRKHA